VRASHLGATTVASAIGLVVAALSPVSAVAESSVKDAGLTRPGEVLVAQPQDLGTLGGATSVATDVSRGVVVGNARTSAHEKHAFAEDLRSPAQQMVDLGTLGGDASVARAVDGELVVGDSTTAGGERHAFVYDLAQRGRGMTDIGARAPQGLLESGALAVDGRRVVGWVKNRHNMKHVFVFHTRVGRMKDLGHPGRSLGRVLNVDVDGHHVVITTTRRHRSESHGWRYDLSNPGWVEMDPGPSFRSTAEGIDDGVIVGAWNGSDHDSYYYDLNAPRPRHRALPGTAECGEAAARGVGDGIVYAEDNCGDGLTFRTRVLGYDLGVRPVAPTELGNLGGSVLPVDTADGIVVGTASTGAGRRGFAYDMRAPEPAMTDLGDLGRADAAPSAVDARIVAGSSRNAAGFLRATAWILSSTGAPLVSLVDTAVNVSERDGVVEVDVSRTWPMDGAASVDYVTTPGNNSQPGADYVETEGAVTFAAGSPTATIAVPLVDDDVSEGGESFGIVLRDPSAGLTLGTPMVSTVEIGASDMIPDLLIGRQFDPLIGNDVYNTTGEGQTQRLEARPGQQVSFSVLVDMDPAAPGSLLLDSSLVTLHASPDPSGAAVAFQLLGSHADVAQQLHSVAGLTVSHRPSLGEELFVRITADASSPVGTELPVSITMSHTGEGLREDVVKAVLVVSE
jgi:probable HAF family extracellular repeat protein